jgi:hypothetical protein
MPDADLLEGGKVLLDNWIMARRTGLRPLLRTTPTLHILILY